MRVRTERGQLWEFVVRLATLRLLDRYHSAYYKARAIVRHDRVLNGDPLHPDRRHG